MEKQAKLHDDIASTVKDTVLSDVVDSTPVAGLRSTGNGFRYQDFLAAGGLSRPEKPRRRINTDQSHSPLRSKVKSNSKSGILTAKGSVNL
jgi:hypothetical protein